MLVDRMDRKWIDVTSVGRVIVVLGKPTREGTFQFFLVTMELTNQ